MLPSAVLHHGKSIVVLNHFSPKSLKEFRKKILTILFDLSHCQRSYSHSDDRDHFSFCLCEWSYGAANDGLIVKQIDFVPNDIDLTVCFDENWKFPIQIRTWTDEREKKMKRIVHHFNLQLNEKYHMHCSSVEYQMDEDEITSKKKYIMKNERRKKERISLRKQPSKLNLMAETYLITETWSRASG